MSILSYPILFYSILSLDFLCKTPGTATVNAKQKDKKKHNLHVLLYIIYTVHVLTIGKENGTFLNTLSQKRGWILSLSPGVGATFLGLHTPDLFHVYSLKLTVRH